jgi:hypothetical protein
MATVGRNMYMQTYGVSVPGLCNNKLIPTVHTFSLFRPMLKDLRIQSVPGREVNILAGHGVGHSKQKKKKRCTCTCVQFRTVSETELFHCTRTATCHVLRRVAKCIDVDGGIY